MVPNGVCTMRGPVQLKLTQLINDTVLELFLLRLFFCSMTFDIAFALNPLAPE